MNPASLAPSRRSGGVPAGTVVAGAVDGERDWDGAGAGGAHIGAASALAGDGPLTTAAFMAAAATASVTATATLEVVAIIAAAAAVAAAVVGDSVGS